MSKKRIDVGRDSAFAGRSIVAAAVALAGCAGESAPPSDLGCDAGAPASRTIACVVAFSPGEASGFGQSHFPEVIYGSPKGGGAEQGSLDVLSLGRGGEIVVGFGGGAIADGEGPDLLIFENPFYIGGDPDHVFAEPGEVSVSDDGEVWATFPCDASAPPYAGCAGTHPVLANAMSGEALYDPMIAGGDAFDLADVGLSRARFVKIRDVSNKGGGDNAGFDLDAAAILHPE